MYGVVLMAALMGGGEAPDHGWGKGWYPGCYGCYGYGCYGNGYTSGHGHGHAYGGCYGGCNGCIGCYGWSCWGCYGCWGNSSPYYPMYTPGTIMPGASMPGADKTTVDNGIAANRARVTIEIPADAKLFIDDQPTKATSEVRHFRTPELKDGETYYYILRAEVTRDGVTQSESKRVLLKPGQEIKASFTYESIAAASRETSTAKR